MSPATRREWLVQSLALMTAAVCRRARAAEVDASGERWPAPVRRGDVVRIVAPGAWVSRQRLEQGLRMVRERFGFVPRYRQDILARDEYLAGDDQRRIDEWNEAVADADARAIWCARGGYGCMRLLDRIDARPLLVDPRWVIGFSDITALHAVLNRAGLVTLHGPMVTSLPSTSAPALAHLEALLSCGAAGPARLEARGVLSAGSASGRLIGGSLATLAHLCGTPYMPSLEGSVLLLEDVGEQPYRVDRYLTQLRLTGALRGIRGVAVGQLSASAPGTADALRRFVSTLAVPAVEGLSVGHDAENNAVPLGAPVELVASVAGELAGVVFPKGPNRTPGAEPPSSSNLEDVCDRPRSSPCVTVRETRRFTVSNDVVTPRSARCVPRSQPCDGDTSSSPGAER